MKTTILLAAGMLAVQTVRAEEFFATAPEALKVAEQALKKEGVDPETLIAVKLDIRAAPTTPMSDEYQAIYDDYGKRDAWLINFQLKEFFNPLSTYMVSYYVLVFSKTEAAVIDPRSFTREGSEKPEENRQAK